jgi:phosphate transport system protein
MDEQRTGGPAASGYDLGHGLRSAYDREVAEVKENILRMGFLVEEQIRAAIAALVAHDAEAALAVIQDDRDINELQRKATAMIAAVIATQNPVARDLRYLLTLDHVSYELERMGDHASS